jgi:O-antigen ligase
VIPITRFARARDAHDIAFSLMPDRIAVRILQLGAVAVVLAATVHRAFDLDRFLITKELVLHATAGIAALFALRAMRTIELTVVDKLLVAYLGLSFVAAVFATNHWLGFRAFAISVSSVLLFWVSRAMSERHSAIANALALAVVLAAVTSLLQAYGVWIDLFSHNRAPGGTLGNRNFVAHAAAFGMPLVFLSALRGNVVSLIGVPVVTAALVLTRSRAAWLAFAASMGVVLVAMLFAPALRRSGKTWGKFLVIVALIGGGVAAALLIPNALKWRSDNPYLESVQGVVNYQEGSGRGRLIQYRRSLMMAARNPLFGVGPGNWGVEYPDHAPANDPSIDTSEAGMTFNPWPSSDWVAFIAERGFLAAIALGAAFVLLALRALRRLVAAQEVDNALVSMTLIATIAGAVVAGAFDAVLLLALPSFIVFSALGATTPSTPLAEPRRHAFVFVLIAISLLAAVRSTTQLVAMELFTGGDRESLRRAAEIDPGNYRVRLRLARGGKSRCEHALAARSLFPHSAAAKSAARGCD